MSPTRALAPAVPLLLLALLAAREALAAPPPPTVSPGGLEAIEEIAHPCPTFLWGASPAAETTGALELAVYELPMPGDLPGEGWSRDAIESLEPVLSVRLPATAPGWTPPLDRCLSASGEYAWAVRAVTDDQPDLGGWSAVRVFRVARPAAIDRPAVERRSPRGGTRSGAAVRSTPAPSAERSELVARPPALDRSTRLVAATSAPDPQTAPTSLRLSQSLALDASSAIFKAGELLLWDDDTNLALGRGALSANSTGTRNTALGAGALSAQYKGGLNIAIGYRARSLSSGGYGNIAVGYTALNRTIGSNNIAIGFRAGDSVLAGDNNILIGNYGFPNLSDAIRIGSNQTTAFIAGRLGLGTYLPRNRLHVVDSSSASTLAGHVAQIENSSTGTSADVLALKIGRTDAPGAGNNFITFYDGSNAILGQCEGNGAGGVVCISSGADYAEFLPRLDPAETLGPGDVVGLFVEGVSRRTTGAQKVMVVSTAPLMLGNDPGEERRGDHAPVVFVGQAPVRVRGPARAGDLLLASGLEDGTAIAVPVAELDPGRLSRVVGRALADHPGDGEAAVLALVGLPDTALLEALLEERDRRLSGLNERVAALEHLTGVLTAGESQEPTP
jgi:hypothetical protein